MSPYLKSNNRGVSKDTFKKRTIPNMFKVGPVTFIGVALVMIAFIGFLFLAQLFQSSTKGYEISELRSQISELKETNKSLEIKAAELRSFANIEKSVEDLSMVKATNVVYLKKTPETFVANR